MRKIRSIHVVLVLVSLLCGQTIPAGARPPVRRFVTRPVAETFGEHPQFGFAGVGVNTATGNATHTAVDLPASLDLLSWSRTYNSLDTGSGPLGRGWTPAFSAHLVPGAGGSVAFHDDDGRVLTFTPNGTGYRRPPDFDADLTRQSGGYLLRHRSGLTETFDHDGRLTRRDADGQRITLGYDGRHRLVTVTHSTGATLTLSYHGAGRLGAVTSSDGRKVSFTYASGVLDSATGPAGVTRYRTGSVGRLDQITGPDGRTVLRNHYDRAGRVDEQSSATHGTVRLAYDTARGTTVLTDPTGARLVYQHDTAGRLVRATGPAGAVVTRTFDDQGRLVAASTPGGPGFSQHFDAHGDLTSRTVGTATTRYGYDGRDRLTTVTDQTGTVTRYGYTGTGRQPTAVTDPTGAVTHYTLRGGLVTAVLDPDGGRTTFGYDTGRRLVSVTDPTHGTTRYSYDTAGHRTAETGPGGAVTRYAYDPAGRLVASTDPTGAVTRYRYSATGSVLAVTDPDGAVSTNTYDTSGRLASSTDPLGHTTRYGYGPDGELATSTDPLGGTSHYTHDPRGQLSGVVDPAGDRTSYGYDPAGDQTVRTDRAGTSKNTYDAQGNVLTSTDAAGRTTRSSYDAAGREVRRVDPTGAVWLTSYDADGHVLTTTDPTGAVTRRRWTKAGRLAEVIDPLGHATRYGYDPAGRVVTVTDPAGGVTRYAYDNAGRRTSATTPAGLVTRFGYDADGRLTATTDPRGGVSRIEYDKRGNKIKTTSAAGAVRTMSYDAANRMVTATDPDGHTTHYGYDAAGNLTSLTDANGAVSRFGYDAAGRQTSATDPLGRITRRDYDAAGNLVTVTDPSGAKLRMSYDAVSELVRRAADDGTEVSFGYDADGRRTRMTDRTGTTRYGYDRAGRLRTVTGPDGSVLSARFDAAGHRVGLRYPDGLALTYSYDPNGRLVGVDDPRAGHTRYTLDADGRLRTENLPDGWARSYDYQGGLLARYRQTRHGHGTDTTVLTRDADGRITVRRGPGRTQRYRYDPAGQLVFATGQPGGDLTAAYDPVGNRTSLTRGRTTTRFGYDAADELLATDTGHLHTAYRYDPSGRLVQRSDPDHRLTVNYDGFGDPVTSTLTTRFVVRLNEITDTSVYNGDGLLTELTTRVGVGPHPVPVDSRTEHYQWSAGDAVPQVIAQHGDQSLWQRDADFSYGYGRISADTARGSATFARDALGSAVQTAATSVWTRARGYDVFGNPEGTELPALRDHPQFGYRGELTSRSRLYLRARTYDPSVGRFTTRDPVAAFVGRTDPVSPYAYADNDPVDFTDPLGRSAISDALELLIQAVFQQASALTALASGLTGGCPDPGSGIDRHQKCFQDVLWWTRGYIKDADCLDADPGCLDTYWHSRRKERAAQAFAIHELDWNRESVWNSFKDKLGASTKIDDNVDWEVGPRKTGGPRIDIVTDERDIIEVKAYQNRAEVTPQLAGYVALGRRAGIDFSLSTELSDWADAFPVSEGFWDFLEPPHLVYVWGEGLPPGHVYFAKGDDAPSNVRAKVQEENPPCLLCIPLPVPEPIPIPVPV
ncbi:MAG TPA: DUF6531 domain-containing protein [Mycobacteriales bacterium]|nr:DUF6531 domain-containing protein [Mycobacteriales bacterium]